MNPTRRNSKSFIVALAASSAMAFGCGEQPTETQEIVDNLIQAGFPATDIQVVGDVVYAGRDAKVSLQASREMLEHPSSEEQYRTNNLVGPSITKICVDGPGFTGVFSTALDLAIQNFEEQPLRFSMARAPSAAASILDQSWCDAPAQPEPVPSGVRTVVVIDEAVWRR